MFPSFLRILCFAFCTGTYFSEKIEGWSWQRRISIEEDVVVGFYRTRAHGAIILYKTIEYYVREYFTKSLLFNFEAS